MPRVQFLETRIPAPAIAALLGLAMKGSAITAGVAIDPSPLRMQVGVGLSQLSAALALAAVAGLWWARTTINPLQPAKASHLVTGGVYRLSRNPLYLSLLMLLVAYAIRLDSPLMWLGPVGFVAYVTRFQIAPEERALALKFGDDYQRYRARTRRWL